MTWEFINALGQFASAAAASIAMLAIGSRLVRLVCIGALVPALLYAIQSHWMVESIHRLWWAVYRFSPVENAWMLDNWFGQIIPWFTVPVAAMHLWIVFKK